MSINPVFTENTALRAQKSAFIKHAHKLTINGLYDWRKPVKEEVFDEMKIFCSENHIAFELREFQPEILVEDREYIERLPAFQIYIFDEYERTIYPTDAVSDLKEIVMNLDKKPPKPKRWVFKIPTFTLFIRKRVRVAASSAPEERET
jgi:hypothetical protein